MKHQDQSARMWSKLLNHVQECTNKVKNKLAVTERALPVDFFVSRHELNGQELVLILTVMWRYIDQDPLPMGAHFVPLPPTARSILGFLFVDQI